VSLSRVVYPFCLMKVVAQLRWFSNTTIMNVIE